MRFIAIAALAAVACSVPRGRVRAGMPGARSHRYLGCEEEEGQDAKEAKKVEYMRAVPAK